MRSDEWDKQEREPFDGMVHDDNRCKHWFDDTGRCLECGKTREQIRKEWT